MMWALLIVTNLAIFADAQRGRPDPILRVRPPPRWTNPQFGPRSSGLSVQPDHQERSRHKPSGMTMKTEVCLHDLPIGAMALIEQINHVVQINHMVDYKLNMIGQCVGDVMVLRSEGTVGRHRQPGAQGMQNRLPRPFPWLKRPERPLGHGFKGPAHEKSVEDDQGNHS